MEKFYRIKKGSPLYSQYFEYIENTKQVNEVVKEFMVEHNIETHQYYASTDVLYIVPTAADLDKFDKVLSKNVGNGLRPFKKTSKINKDWVELLKSKNLRVLGKPFLGFYFKVAGKFSTRLFNIEEEVYASMSAGYDFPNPENEGFVEVKASEFYKIIEDAEAKML